MRYPNFMKYPCNVAIGGETSDLERLNHNHFGRVAAARKFCTNLAKNRAARLSVATAINQK